MNQKKVIDDEINTSLSKEIEQKEVKIILPKEMKQQGIDIKDIQYRQNHSESCI